MKHYKCTECDKSFINKDTLSKHMSAHLEERNFKCGKCGKLFKRLSHVREHIKIHAGSRPFPCTICEKSFKTSVGLPSIILSICLFLSPVAKQESGYMNAFLLSVSQSVSQSVTCLCSFHISFERFSCVKSFKILIKGISQ